MPQWRKFWFSAPSQHFGRATRSEKLGPSYRCVCTLIPYRHPGTPPQNLRGAKETNPGIIHMEMKRLSPLDSESLSLGEERKWLPCTLLKSDLPAFLQGKKVNLWLRAHSKSCLQPRAVCLSAFLKSLKKSTHLRLRTFKKSPFLMTSLLRHSFFRKGAVLWFCA